MSHQVLARKWRPKDFQSLVGQEHVKRILSHALEQQRLHHAYLFTGTRGVGKTTIARIFAKCLNCEQGNCTIPCNTCTTCTAIDSGRFVDLIEVDAASRTKVEDTRELLDNVQYLPTQGRYKVYLIDEVHMLSGHSFNALLKTLEEPPEHVKFLLATTDPQRLPITVLSRCLQLHLKCIPNELITQQMAYILDQEGISYEPAAIEQLAYAAQGSLRDGLSLLDQAIAYGQGQVQKLTVNSMLGLLEHDQLYKILAALAQQNAAELAQQTYALANAGVDFEQTLIELLKLLQQIATLQLLGDTNSANTFISEQLSDLAKQLNPEDVQLYYQIALNGRRDLPYAPSARSGFEMLLLRMLAFTPLNTSPKKLPAVTDTAQLKTAAPSAAVKITQAPSANKPRTTAETSPQNVSVIENISLTDTTLSWETILPKLNLSGLTAILAKHCSLQSYSEDSLDIVLDASQAASFSDMQEQRLNKALNEFFGQLIKVTIHIGSPVEETVAARELRAQNERQTEAIKTLEQDEKIHAILQTFDATILPDSIQAL